MELLPIHHSRRTFLKASSAAVGGVALGEFGWPVLAEVAGKSPAMTVTDLPKGGAPKPVSFPHFPSRLHAFVWRNWPLVTPERMARVVGAKPADIKRMGRAMRLGNPPPVIRAGATDYGDSFLKILSDYREISTSKVARW